MPSAAGGAMFRSRSSGFLVQVVSSTSCRQVPVSSVSKVFYLWNGWQLSYKDKHRIYFQQSYLKKKKNFHSARHWGGQWQSTLVKPQQQVECWLQKSNLITLWYLLMPVAGFSWLKFYQSSSFVCTSFPWLLNVTNKIASFIKHLLRSVYTHSQPSWSW